MAPVRRPARKCPHGRKRPGSSFCEHRRLRPRRRKCGGSSFCVHGRRRAGCREHGRLRPRRRECGGSSFCEHARLRHQCGECGGSSVCEHGRRRQQCRDCSNFVCQIQGCPRQDLPFAGAPSLLGHMQRRHGDNPRAVTRSKELEVHQHSATRRSPLSTSTTCPSAAAGWNRRRPTPSRTLPCRPRGATSWRSQLRRAPGASVALGSGHKLLVLRYNPDAFKIAGVTRRTTKKKTRGRKKRGPRKKGKRGFLWQSLTSLEMQPGAKLQRISRGLYFAASRLHAAF